MHIRLELGSELSRLWSMRVLLRINDEAVLEVEIVVQKKTKWCAMCLLTFRV